MSFFIFSDRLSPSALSPLPSYIFPLPSYISPQPSSCHTAVCS